MTNKKVYCGFSANPELYLEYTTGVNGKNPIHQEGINLSGSTVNVAKCIQNMGHDVHAQILTAPRNGILNTMYYNALLELLHSEQIYHTHYEILATPSFAHININDSEKHHQLLSKKGQVIPEKIANVVKEIEAIRESISWVVCSGLQISEVELARALFKKGEKSKRILVPKPELIQDPLFDGLLKCIDLVIMNKSEFGLYHNTDPNSLLERGPCMVIITEDEKGGKVYSSQGSFTYEPYPAGKILSPVGAGDWFTGSIAAWGLENNTNLDLSLDDLKRMVAFAAQVSSQKLSYMGGSNGPFRKDII